MAEGAALALDLDGTLLDAERRQCELAAAALRETGHAAAFDPTRFWALKREGATTREAFVSLGVEEWVGKRAAAYWALHVEAPGWLALDRPLPGAREALAWLRGHSVLVVVLTARQHPDRVRGEVERLGLRELVDDLLVVAPSAAVREKGAALARLAPRGYVGDSETDGAAARKAGVPFVAVTTGQRSPAFLHARGFATADSVLAARRRLLA